MKQMLYCQDKIVIILKQEEKESLIWFNNQTKWVLNTLLKEVDDK